MDFRYIRIIVVGLFRNMDPLDTTFFHGRSYKILRAAIESIQSEDRPADIVIIPPNVDEQTDEEDIEEDVLMSNEYPADVPGTVEVFEHFEEGDDLWDEEDFLPLSELKKMWQTMESTDETSEILAPEWTSEPQDITMTETQMYTESLEKLKSDLKDYEPVELFELFFDENIVEHIVVETNRYATQKNDHSFNITEEDLKSFIGILVFTGYHTLPRERSYWSLDDDLKVEIVTNCMSRNRYYSIKKYIHLANNANLDLTDKLTKIRPLMILLNKNFIKWGVFHKNLSIDESMVRYYGRHSAKQFIRGKPVRFGYKNWMLCSSTGYCYQFDTYAGAKNYPTVSNIPLGSKVVLDLLTVIKCPSDHIIYFDNYFTSHRLMNVLREKGFRATGTVRDNRTKNCPLKPPKEMKKEERGSFVSQYDEKNRLLFVRWMDNSVVTMCTNHDAVYPTNLVKRWSSKEKARIEVQQPRVIANYNLGMGGVDLHDQGINNYPIMIRGKKWWWPLFTNMINMSVVNAWRLHRIVSNEKLDLFNFIRSLSRHYLRVHKKATHSRASGSVPPSLRYSGGGHYPKRMEKQLRCKQCHQKVRWQCILCKISLCLERECFIQFHTKSNN